MKKMTTKIKESFTNNLSLKLIAIIIAAIVWLVVVNVNDPEKTIIIYSIPVTVVDEKAVTDMDMVYSVTSGDYVNITVSGKRSVLNGLSAGDFIATASLKELSKVNAVPIEIKAKDAYLNNKVTIEKQSENALMVQLENIEVKNYNISVEYKGSAGQGYVPGDYILSEATVDVQAPVSVLERIESAIAICNLEGNQADFTKDCKILLYDKNGKRVKNKNIKLSFKKVDVSVEILYSKEIPLIVETIGNPADGYQVEETVLSQDTVILLADREILDTMDQLVIDPNISLAGETKDVVRNIDLTEYLPEGIIIQGESNIELTVKITELTQKVFKLEQKDIDVINVSDELEVDSIKTVKVTLQGEKDIVNNVSVEELNATIDLEGIENEEVEVPVVITIPEGTELIGEVVATVKLK